MMKAKNLPGFFWGEAVTTVVYLLNRSPTWSVEGMTPYEAWHGTKSSPAHLCTFGCIMHVKNTKPHLSKLEDRSTRMIFVGYEPRSKAYQAYYPRTGCVRITLNAVFDELAQWDWSKEEGVHGDLYAEPSEFVITTTTTAYQNEDISQAEQLVPIVPSPPAAEEWTPSSVPALT
jgi:hypothetical protein